MGCLGTMINSKKGNFTKILFIPVDINTIWTIFSVFHVSTEKMVKFEAVVFAFCHDDDNTLAQIIVVGFTCYTEGTFSDIALAN